VIAQEGGDRQLVGRALSSAEGARRELALSQCSRKALGISLLGAQVRPRQFLGFALLGVHARPRQFLCRAQGRARQLLCRAQGRACQILEHTLLWSKGRAGHALLYKRCRSLLCGGDAGDEPTVTITVAHGVVIITVAHGVVGHTLAGVVGHVPQHTLAEPSLQFKRAVEASNHLVNGFCLNERLL
jgi:hypothetical protein